MVPPTLPLPASLPLLICAETVVGVSLVRLAVPAFTKAQLPIEPAPLLKVKALTELLTKIPVPF